MLSAAYGYRTATQVFNDADPQIARAVDAMPRARELAQAASQSPRPRIKDQLSHRLRTRSANDQFCAVICAFLMLICGFDADNHQPFCAAKARHAWPTIQKQLDSAGIEYRLTKRPHPATLRTKTRAALKSGIESVVVVGGDGTLSEAAEGFFQFNDDLDITSRADQSFSDTCYSSRRHRR